MGGCISRSRGGRARPREGGRPAPTARGGPSELRRRLGGTFTLRELASEYVRADVWARERPCGSRGSRLAAHDVARRGCRVPPVLPWCRGLRAVSMLERPSRERRTRTRRRGSAVLRVLLIGVGARARVPPRDRIRSDAGRATGGGRDRHECSNADPALAAGAGSHRHRHCHGTAVGRACPVWARHAPPSDA